MYYAYIMDGLDDYIFSGKDAYEIVEKLNTVQDLACLRYMGKLYNKKKNRPAVQELTDFLDKVYSRSLTIEDIKNLNIHFTIGDLACYGFAECEEEFENLKKRYSYAVLK